MTPEQIITSDETSAPVWRTPRRFQLHLRIDEGRLASVLESFDGTLTPAYRRRLLWFRVRCVLRSIGLLAGVLTVILAALAVPVVVIFGATRLPIDPTTAKVGARLVTDGIIVGVSLWVYLLVGISTFYPATSFARSAYETARHIPHPAGTWQPSTGYAFANSTGNTARSLLRALTGRRVNVTLRPDIATEAASIAETIMVTVPTGGSAYWQAHTNSAHLYSDLLHDINALIAVGRIDLVKQTIDTSQIRREREIFIKAGDPEIATYLHPLGRRTVLDAAATYLVPLLALAISLLAVIVTLSKA